MRSSEFIKKYHPGLNQDWELGLSESKIDRYRKLSTVNGKISTVDGGSLRTDGKFSNHTSSAWLLVTNSYSGGDPWSLGTAHKMCIHITHPAANDFAEQLPVEATATEIEILKYLENATVFTVSSLVVVHNAATGFGGILSPNCFSKNQKYGLRLAKLRRYAISIACMLKSSYPILFEYAGNDALLIAASAREINPLLYSKIITGTQEYRDEVPVLKFEELHGAILTSLVIKEREINLYTDKGTFTIYATTKFYNERGKIKNIVNSPIAIHIYTIYEESILSIYDLDKGRVRGYSVSNKIGTKYAISSRR